LLPVLRQLARPRLVSWARLPGRRDHRRHTWAPAAAAATT